MQTTQSNPFALVRASDYTDDQVNRLWVEIGEDQVAAILEPRSVVSKYILGGKGTGKTHLLRHASYPVIRLRMPRVSGVDVIKSVGYLAVFLRATILDAPRFEESQGQAREWQQVFATYLELKLIETALESLVEVRRTSPEKSFSDRDLVRTLLRDVADPSTADLDSLESLLAWVIESRKRIDLAVNNFAFTGSLAVFIPFGMGTLAPQVGPAVKAWCPELRPFQFLFFIDEFENFTVLQQQVLNTLIRFAEGRVSYRVCGRLYSRSTLSTIGGGEENREGSEFKTVKLDGILQSNPLYANFANRFIMKRLAESRKVGAIESAANLAIDPSRCFSEPSSDQFYLLAMGLESPERSLASVIAFGETLYADLLSDDAEQAGYVMAHLTQGIPPLFQRLNILLFVKRFGSRERARGVAEEISAASRAYLQRSYSPRSTYKRDLNHWKADLLAQIYREWGAMSSPYAGFGTLTRISSGNPRNLLVILGKAYEIATFRGIDFMGSAPLPVSIQTEACIEAANFMWDSDSNFGAPSDDAKTAVSNLATLLRTARYAINIPEVSPLAVSFSFENLDDVAKKVVSSALNYSFVFEVQNRPNRNDQRVDRKIHLNPLLSPRWGLPVMVRGDLGISVDVANSIFNPALKREFDEHLRSLAAKWSNPFRRVDGPRQPRLI